MDTHITVSEIMSIKFLGLLIDNKLTWKPYGRELAIKLNRACYIMRIIKPMMSRESLITIYHVFTPIHHYLSPFSVRLIQSIPCHPVAYYPPICA